MSTQRDVLKLIKVIRESFTGSVQVYTEGSCYKFYEILKSQFSDAVPYITEDRGHIVTEIAGDFYDIKGLFTEDTELTKLHSTAFVEAVKHWSWDLFVQGYECPACDHIFSREDLDKYDRRRETPDWLKVDKPKKYGIGLTEYGRDGGEPEWLRSKKYGKSRKP